LREGSLQGGNPGKGGGKLEILPDFAAKTGHVDEIIRCNFIYFRDSPNLPPAVMIETIILHSLIVLNSWLVLHGKGVMVEPPDESIWIWDDEARIHLSWPAKPPLWTPGCAGFGICIFILDVAGGGEYSAD
jgi:hypothetical protein